MQSFFSLLALDAWKPALAALLLPPVPLLLLCIVGARLILRHRVRGWLLVLVGLLLLALFSLRGTAVILRDQFLRPPPALAEGPLADLQARVKAGERVAIVVLGGGRRAYAPEYGVADLEPPTLERLRYGVWLSRRIGADLAFSGGLGWEAGGREGSSATEAEVAARVARSEFNQPIRWLEATSRDTRENAALSLPPLRAAGIRTVVVVTHAWHMPRALTHFQRSAGADLKVIPAPMGQVLLTHRWVSDWLPSGDGLQENRRVLRELLATLAG